MKNLPVKLLTDESTPAYVLLAIIFTRYDAECFDWQPEFLREQIETDFNISLSDLQADKIQAAIVVLTMDSFETYWDVFEICCHLFCNQPVNAEVQVPLSLEELVRGLAEVVAIRGDEISDIKFSPEVRCYVGQVLYDSGFLKAPELLSFAFMPEIHEDIKTENVDKDQEKHEAVQEVLEATLEMLDQFVNSLGNAEGYARKKK